MLSINSKPILRMPAFSISTQPKRRESCSQGLPKCRAADKDMSQTVNGLRSFSAALFAAGVFTTSHASAEAAGNASMIDQIHFYQAEKSAHISQQMPESPAQLLEAASIQLQKVETLIGIGQYESARQQLRQGAASTIRIDLRAYDRTHTIPDTPQAGKAIVHQVEVLDTALRKSKPAGECKQLVQQIRHDMSKLLASP